MWLRREPAPHKLHSYFQRAMWRAHAHIHACTQVNKNNKKKFKKELYGAGTKVDRYLNRLRNSEINPQSVSTFFKKKEGVKITHLMKDRPFNKWSWGTRVCAWRRMKPDLYLSPRTKIHSKRIKDLNIRPETLKLLRKIFQDMDISRDF